MPVIHDGVLVKVNDVILLPLAARAWTFFFSPHHGQQESCEG